MTIYNIYRCNTKNVGDLCCAPRLFFDFKDSVDIDIDELPKTPFASDSTCIIGGGGIFFPGFTKPLQTLAAQNARLIIWGAGTNVHDVESAVYPPLIDRADMVGIRDWGTYYEWVPCVSCMAPEFDKPRSIEHDVVVYEHLERPVPVNDPAFPRMTNKNVSLAAALDFIGSGETVLTTTYHGAFWGALLGRRVVCHGWSSRFFHMRHSPKLVSSWKEWNSERAPVYAGALAECRDATTQFAKRVLGSLEVPTDSA